MEGAARGTVVLVHGLWMTGLEMALLGRRLRACGYTVRRFHYRSVRQGVPGAARALHRFLGEVPGAPLHFVAHSLGGLVVRRLLHDHPEPRLGRVVTLGTPHRRSCVAAGLGRRSLGRRLLGAALPGGLDGTVTPWQGAYPLASIAGTLSFGPGQLFAALPRPHDGTVAEAETRLPGADHLSVRATHTGLLLSREVARQTCHYLSTGGFRAAPAA